MTTTTTEVIEDRLAIILAARCPECGGCGDLVGPNRSRTAIQHRADCLFQPLATQNLQRTLSRLP
jgi:hypothetical protein